MFSMPALALRIKARRKAPISLAHPAMAVPADRPNLSGGEPTALIVLPAQRWWIIALRGLAAILFGILAWVAPGIGLWALVIFFGAYALVHGVLSLMLASRVANRRWGTLMVEGVAGILAGALAVLWPAITALALLMLIAIWAVVTGVIEIVEAVRLREQIRGEWLLGLMGLVSIAFGVLIALFPRAGALAVVLWIGSFSILFGILAVALAFRVRAWGRIPERRVPTSGTPAAV
jgi:uncharacterized membrane protein HdeD (DUF308 family)